MDITGIDLFDQKWMWHVPRVGSDYMDITSIDLFNQNVGMVCAKATLRYSWISLVLVYLIKYEYGMCQSWTQMFMDSTGIDLFD